MRWSGSKEQKTDKSGPYFLISITKSEFATLTRTVLKVVCTLVLMPNLKYKSWIDSVRVTRITKELKIVCRLFLIIVARKHIKQNRNCQISLLPTYMKRLVIQVNKFVSFSRNENNLYISLKFLTEPGHKKWAPFSNGHYVITTVLNKKNHHVYQSQIDDIWFLVHMIIFYLNQFFFKSNYSS